MTITGVSVVSLGLMSNRSSCLCLLALLKYLVRFFIGYPLLM